MAKELGGYGPTAGESMGGTGANLNQQGGHNNSGVHWGGGSGHGNNGGQGNTSSSNSTSTVMKPGESYLTPWGDVVINKDGLPVMNGVVMTEDNSSLVDNPLGGVSRVLNSLISDMPSLFTKATGNNHDNNITAVNAVSPETRASDMEKSSKMVSALIDEKQNQKNQIAAQISEKNKKIEEMKKIFKHHSYHGITDLERDVDELQRKSNQLDADISKLYDYKNTLKSDVDKIKDAVAYTATFYEKVTEKYGEKAKLLAKSLADKANGKTIRGVDDALAAFDRYRSSLGDKFNSADRAAIVAGIQALDATNTANSLAKYSKAFGYLGNAIDLADILVELKNALTTDNWRPVFVKLEIITANRAAVAISAIVFSIITGVPMGIVGFGVLVALAGSFFDEQLVNEINSQLGI